MGNIDRDFTTKLFTFILQLSLSQVYYKILTIDKKNDESIKNQNMNFLLSQMWSMISSDNFGFISSLVRR